jgi:outer membrane immunogenic protein
MTPLRSLGALCWGALGLSAILLAASPASADGMPSRAARAASIDAPATWTGFYIGTHAGLATGDGTGTGLVVTDFDLSGALYGVQAGYNWQVGTVVVGIEGSWSHSTVEGNTACILILECKLKVDSIATVVGRAGLALDRTLVYGLGGVAWGDVSSQVGILGFPLLTGNETQVGWVAGFGVEQMLSKNISARIEYSHIDLGSKTHELAFIGGIGPTIPDKVDVKLDTIRLGVNIKLY